MHQVQIEIPGAEVVLETGEIARQAGGSVILRQGRNVLLATAVAAREERPGIGFFPLTVEYRERMAAAGRIPGGYLRREGRITDAEVLTSRLADRTVRPLFPKGFRLETQVLLTVLSADEEVEPSCWAITAAAAALHLSDIPWDGPVAGVRLARKGGEWVFQPPRASRAGAELDLFVSSSADGLIMVEGEGAEAGESRVTGALRRAADVNRTLIDGIERLRELSGCVKRDFDPPEADEGLEADVARTAAEGVLAALGRPGKAERAAALEGQRQRVLEQTLGESAEQAAGQAFDALCRKLIRRRIATDGVRPDGRGAEEIRPISGRVAWLPRPHGSAIFTRGETQALVSCTLGTVSDEQRYETLEGNRQQRFLLHYNFPPYSVGEVRPMRGPGRREIGHGTLALRALEPVLPSPEDFAYTIRLVSDISESNGSSSMATVCGGTLALMDAGVPIEAPVAGIAMGLIREGDRYVVLSDILGEEDHLGDMDFKVAGTASGITAIQMDNKLGAIPPEVLAEALEQARKGRLQILEEMQKILAAPREDLADSAPRVRSLRIRPQRIGTLIGPGGKTIQELQSSTRTRISVDDDGLVRVYAEDADGARAALRKIEALTLEPKLGEIYEGRVTLVRDFFAIVELAPGIEGKLHVSQLDNRRVAKVQDLLSRGETVRVRVQGVDRQGRIELSRKAAL